MFITIVHSTSMTLNPYTKFSCFLLSLLLLISCDNSGVIVQSAGSVALGAALPSSPLPFEVEAEDLELSGVSIRSTHQGFSGTAYADYTGSSGTYMSWGFIADFASEIDIELRYALGSTASRTVDVEVDGDIVDQLTFEPTGAWNQWENVSVQINASVGEHTVRLISAGESGPNVDTVAMEALSDNSTPPGSPSTPEMGEAPVTIEAEDAVLSGVLFQSFHDNFSGTGYADFVGATDAFIEFDFNSASTVLATLDLRYALAASASRTMAVEVNGDIVDQIAFVSTGGWSTWSNIALPIEVIGGNNTVRLIAIGESGPNFDFITVSSSSLADRTPFSYQVSTQEQILFDTPVLFLNHHFGNHPDWIVRTIELTNTTDEIVTVNSLSLDGPFSLVNPALENGTVIDRGESLQIDVRFNSEDLEITRNNFLFSGTLQVNSSDPVTPVYNIPLSGTDLGQPDVRAELPPAGMFEMMGLVSTVSGDQPRASTIGGVGVNSPLIPGEASVNVDGVAERAIFFEAADATQPVRIQQIASMHNSGGSNLGVRAYDYNAALGAENELSAFTQVANLGAYSHDPAWFRTFLPPRANADSTRVADFNTNGQIISFIANGSTPLGPKTNGNIALQAFEIYDQKTLERIENSYIFLFDFSGGLGGDWNDNIYFVENIKPFSAALQFSAISDGDGSLNDGDTNINLDSSFTLTININQQDVSFDASTINGFNVQLTNVNTGQAVLGSVNSTAFLNAITFTPAQLLDANTDYLLTVNDVLSNGGEAYENVEINFTTGESTTGTVLNGIAFEETAVIDPDGNGTYVTGLSFNTDQTQLYATTLAGKLLRWDVDQFANLSNPQSLQVASEFHALTGLSFDKNDANRLWYVDNTPVGSAETGLAENFSSKLSYIDINANTSAFTGTITDYATGFPRGSRDHMFNSIEFGPDGFLYGSVGSTSTTGTREFPLSASVLRIDTDRQPPAGGFNVNTDQGYNPNALDAPVTVHAQGLRNAFDLVWHSNGFLYAANNGSIGGGGAPDDPSTPTDESIPSGVATQRDYLYRVEPDGYYGHPNTTQGNFLLAGANPTADIDPAEEILYPVGTQPDPNYRGFAYDFGLNRSPNGSIEYTADAFSGVLSGTLMVVEWSGGDRIVGLTLNALGQVVDNFVVADGFSNPIDIAVHENTGSIFIAEMGAVGELTVLMPVE